MKYALAAFLLLAPIVAYADGPVMINVDLTKVIDGQKTVVETEHYRGTFADVAACEDFLKTDEFKAAYAQLVEAVAEQVPDVTVEAPRCE